MNRELAGHVDFPAEWLDGHRWAIGPQVAVVADLDGLGRAVGCAGMLEDGTNIVALVFAGGQRLLRLAPGTDWALEERFDGEQPPLATLQELWGSLVDVARAALAQARREAGS